MIKKVSIYTLFIFLWFGLSGCSTSSRAPLTQTQSLEEVIQEEVENSTSAEQSRDVAAVETQAADDEEDEASRAAKKRKWLTNLPVYGKRKIARWVHYFAKRDPDRFVRFLTRGDSYKDVVENTLEEYNLPKEFFYLALIESGYQNHAYSHAGAVGTWQFIRSTGRQYGLRIDHYVDERRDPIRATESAARYLRDLYGQFKSWHLAMAAYNCGEARVRRAIRRGRTKSFWELSRRKLLPPETRNYVPKFIAAILVGESPERYGLTADKTDSYPSVESVELPAPLKLSHIAKTLNVSTDEIKNVNPHIRRGVTPPGKTYELWVPQNKAELAKAKFQDLKKFRIAGLKSRPYRSSASVHRVRRGESLSTIARKYRVSVSTLKRMNGLRSSRIYAGQRLRLKSRSYRARVAKGTHRVRRGQTLGSIARRYGTSVGKLKRLNGLRNSHIYAGQRLQVNSRNYRAQVSARGTHHVRRGQTLGSIARRYGTTVGNLKRLNGIEGSNIYVGQKLKVNGKNVSKANRSLARVKKPKLVTYRVRRGDNLTSIAKKFRVSVRDLKKKNQLKQNKIFVGQNLKIHSRL